MKVSRRSALVFAAAAALAVPLAAHGATRHAAPGGGGTSCLESAPCNLETAINSAGTGDEIVLAPGDYNGFGPLNPLRNTLSIHGTVGQLRPRLTSPLSTLLLNVGSTLRHVEIATTQAPASPLLDLDGTATLAPARAPVIIDDVVARTPGTALALVNAGGGNRIRNAVLLTDGAGPAVSVNNAIQVAIEHATIIGQGPGATALLVRSPTTDTSVVVLNSIVRGSAQDVDAIATAPGTTVVSLEGSAYRPAAISPLVKQLASPLALDPIFVNAAAGDFHQAATSPTIDAAAGSTVATDFDGQPRVAGLAPDIGADEYMIPSTATTGAATELTPTGATLNGTINPNGLSTTFRFDYGTTTAYGVQTTSVNAGADSTARALSAAITGLAPGTTYHVRVVATNALGAVPGTDVVFATPALPDTLAPGLGKLSLSKKLVAPGTKLTLTFQLTEAATISAVLERATQGRTQGTRCAIKAKTGAKCTKLTRIVTLRSKLAAANPAKLAIPAKPGGKKLLRGSYQLTVTAADAAGNASRTRRITFTVK
jgi:hypothetical protein